MVRQSRARSTVARRAHLPSLLLLHALGATLHRVCASGLMARLRAWRDCSSSSRAAYAPPRDAASVAHGGWQLIQFGRARRRLLCRRALVCGRPWCSGTGRLGGRVPPGARRGALRPAPWEHRGRRPGHYQATACPAGLLGGTAMAPADGRTCARRSCPLVRARCHRSGLRTASPTRHSGRIPTAYGLLPRWPRRARRPDWHYRGCVLTFTARQTARRLAERSRWS